MSRNTLYSNYYLNCISRNPYRVLGVTADASKKDITTNVSKYKAFLKVGKSISGEFDNISSTSKIDRSVDSIISAEKAIELPIDRLRWTLFWFVNETPIDTIALNHVKSGHIDKAITIWSKVETVSSLLNIVVLELIQQNWAKAALYADKLFSNHASSLCSLIDETLDLSSEDLMRLFMGVIAEDNYDVLKQLYYAFPKCLNFDEVTCGAEYRYLTDSASLEQTPEASTLLLPCLKCKKGYFYFSEGCELTEEEFLKTKDDLTFIYVPLDSDYEIHRIYKSEDVITPSRLWDTCIRETLAVPYIKNAEARLSEYKAIPKEDSEKRFKYAKSKLLNSLSDIQSYLGSDSTEYKTLNNKIVKEALQSAIDYYNNSQEPEEIARETKDFVWTIITIAIPESVLQQRCKENYDTLCEICSTLAPESVSYYHSLLKNQIDKYQDEASTIKNASAFVNRCFPYLMSISSVLGPSNAYYRRMCTLVAKYALEDIITDYNDQSETLYNRLENATSSNRSDIIKQIQEMMKLAVITMYHLKKLDLESDFRQNRFSKNYDIIAEQARGADALGTRMLLTAFGSEVLEEDFNNDLKKYKPDTRDEKGYFLSITNLKDCYHYREIFPNGKYSGQVDAKIEEYEYNSCSSIEDLNKFTVRYPSTKYDIEAKRDEIIFKSCKTIEDYESYIAKYSTYKKEAEKRIDDLKYEHCRTSEDYAEYLRSNPDGGHRLEAQNKIDELDYQHCKSIEDFENYIKSHPNSRRVRDARIRIVDEKAWMECKKKNTWKAYREYLMEHPNGHYSSEAIIKSASPWERFKKWRKSHAYTFAIIAIALIMLLIAGITNGVLGMGYVFGAVAVFGIFVAVFVIGMVGFAGKRDMGCGSIIASLSISPIAGLIAYGLIPWGKELEHREQLKNAIESLPQTPSVLDYQEFFQNYGDQMDYDEKLNLLDQYYNISLDSCYSTLWNYSEGGYDTSISGLGYLKDFSEYCTDASFKRKAEEKYAFLIDSLYNDAESLQTFDGWERFQNAVPSDGYRDSQEKKEALDPHWLTDKNAWQTASELNSEQSYQKYLDLYPHGQYKSKAESKLIDLQVDATFRGEHGYLPEMDKTSRGSGISSYIRVYNNTSYTLTLLYSGKESKKLELSPQTRGSLWLKNGTYRIAAFVSAVGVQRYAGTETLNGGSYEVEYYIYTTTSSSYHLLN